MTQTTPVIFSEAELEAIETLANAAYEVAPGERCPMCHRRRNRQRSEDEPREVREVRFRGPSDLVDALEEGIDALQEFTRIDPYAYPRIRLLEALLVLGSQNRERIRSYFEDRDETAYGEGS